MVFSFENCDVILSEDHAKHINVRHVDLDKNLHASKFKRNFNLTSCLAFLIKKTWEDRSDYAIVEKGFKDGYGHYFMYVFKMPKVIGFDPWGFPTKDICIYYSWKPGVPNDLF